MEDETESMELKTSETNIELSATVTKKKNSWFGCFTSKSEGTCKVGGETCKFRSVTCKSEDASCKFRGITYKFRGAACKSGGANCKSEGTVCKYGGS